MHTMRSLFFSAALAADLLVLVWLVPATALSAHSPQMTRIYEPVIISGEQLPLFDGAEIDDLFVYAYANAAWQPIPVQIDEVDASGAYTVENGLLDANDELVFMAMDLGEQAAASEWITDTEARSYARYEIQVSDPLSPGQQGWVYLYRSAALDPPLPTDYVSWDAASQRLIGSTYVVGFSPTVHPAMDSLELNGSGVDALDRGKIRLEATCYISIIPVPVTLTEEDLAGALDYTPDIEGPVRVGGGSTDGSSWAYHSLYHSYFTMNIGGLTPPPPCTALTINQVRLSSDWLDPATAAMAPAIYYDGNTGAGVAIDGVQDSVPPTPVSTWKQVSGGQGSIVQVMDVTIGGGQIANYYKDDQTIDPDDTGDGRSFGDTGFVVTDPTGQISAETLHFFLDPAQPNLGATYQSCYANPLQFVVTAQDYEPRYYVYMPLLLKNPY